MPPVAQGPMRHITRIYKAAADKNKEAAFSDVSLLSGRDRSVFEICAIVFLSCFVEVSKGRFLTLWIRFLVVSGPTGR